MSSPVLKRAALRSHEIKQLEYHLVMAVDARNLAIREAYAGGDTIADLSRATGLSRTMLYRILDKETTNDR